MSKLNINKNEWLELVFEGKNKAYGAYQLRQDEGSTTMKAFFGGLLLLGAISGGLALSSFDEKPNVVGGTMVCKITPVDLSKIKLPEVKKEETKMVKKGTALKAPITKNLTNPVVVNNVATNTPITKNDDLGKTVDPNAAPGGDGSGSPKGGITVEAVPVIDTPIVDNAVRGLDAVDKSPYFPGGMNEFLKTVGKNFRTPEMEEEKTVKVIVNFVVEKDGSISNIVAVRDPGFGLGNEAIRVLKNIKTKWNPGVFKGQPVRTLYSLPITVNIQSAE